MGGDAGLERRCANLSFPFPFVRPLSRLVLTDFLFDSRYPIRRPHAQTLIFRLHSFARVATFPAREPATYLRVQAQLHTIRFTYICLPFNTYTGSSTPKVSPPVWMLAPPLP